MVDKRGEELDKLDWAIRQITVTPEEFMREVSEWYLHRHLLDVLFARGNTGQRQVARPEIISAFMPVLEKALEREFGLAEKTRATPEKGLGRILDEVTKKWAKEVHQAYNRRVKHGIEMPESEGFVKSVTNATRKSLRTKTTYLGRVMREEFFSENKDDIRWYAEHVLAREKEKSKGRGR